MNKISDLKVNFVISPVVDSKVAVFLDSELFNKIEQSRKSRFTKETPMLRYSTKVTTEGKYLRAYDFEGVILEQFYDKDGDRKNHFFMSETDVIKLNIPQYQRKTPEVSNLRLSGFNLALRASV